MYSITEAVHGFHSHCCMVRTLVANWKHFAQIIPYLYDWLPKYHGNSEESLNSAYVPILQLTLNMTHLLE